jgi:RHS repeat-associated protein
VANYSAGTETTFYVGGILEKVVSAGVTHYKHRIDAPTGLVAIYDRPTSGPEETFYFTKDHLGSIDTITDQSGAVEARLSYDAFGARRDESDWHGAPPSNPWAGSSRRGYTEHEHLDNLGLTHMNGRVQDPAIGRFLSADPYIPDPLSSQSFNRYSYVQNNPLTRIDPSGFDDGGRGSGYGPRLIQIIDEALGGTTPEPFPTLGTQLEPLRGPPVEGTVTPSTVLEEKGPDKSSVPCDFGPCGVPSPQTQMPTCVAGQTGGINGQARAPCALPGLPSRYDEPPYTTTQVIVVREGRSFGEWYVYRSAPGWELDVHESADYGRTQDGNAALSFIIEAYFHGDLSRRDTISVDSRGRVVPGDIRGPELPPPPDFVVEEPPPVVVPMPDFEIIIRD